MYPCVRKDPLITLCITFFLLIFWGAKGGVGWGCRVEKLMTMIYIRKIISVLAIIQEGKWKGSHKQSYIDINGVLTALITFLFLIFLIHHFPPYRDSTATPEWFQITFLKNIFCNYFEVLIRSCRRNWKRQRSMKRTKKCDL